MENGSLGGSRGKMGEIFWLAVIHGAAYCCVFLLLGMAGYIFFRGFRVLSLRFFYTVTSTWKGTVGIGGNLINTVYIVVLTLLIALPVGVGTAVYLNEYARRNMFTCFISFALEILAGIPSVIFGLFGMVFFGNVMGLGYSLLNGALTLSMMVLPLIVKNTQAALEAVPQSYRQGAVGLGAAKWYLIRTILLPCAGKGILTGVILSVGRIMGESAALLFTAGSARLLPGLGVGIAEMLEKLRNKIMESGGTLTVELYLQMQNGEYQTAFAIGCVLMIMAFLVQFAIKLICGEDSHEKH
jgi:phosphate transport system permease protein